MSQTLPLSLPKTVNRSQLATALGYARVGGGINWRSFYAYIEDVLGEDWEKRLRIHKGQRVFNTIQTEKIITALELKAELFN